MIQRINARVFFLISIAVFSASLMFASAKELESDPVSADAPPLPQAMGVLGDSITEGMLTDFSLEHPPSFGQFIHLYKIAQQSQSEPHLESLRKEYAKPQHSWATGTDESDIVLSHLERLAAYQSGIRGYNFAVSGSKIKDLLDQVDTLLQTEVVDKVTIDYVALLIGANDLNRLKMEKVTSVADYGFTLETVIRKLLNSNPHRSILFIGVPDIFEVFEKSKNIVAASFFGKKHTCKEVRENVYGNTVLFDDTNLDTYLEVKRIKAGYDLAGKEVFDRLQSEYPAAHLKAISNYINPARIIKTLSIDCFHPSLWGQAAISEITWSLGFWPDLQPPE